MTVGLVLGGAGWAEAEIDFSGSDNTYTASASGLTQGIPDNSPSGAAYALNFADTGLSISSVSVTLDISGGYNGDLTVYLSHGSQISYLLVANPAMSSSGFNAMFIAGTDNPVPTGGSGLVSGTTFTAASGDLAGFNSTDPNGNWTLFFADLSPGDTSTLTGFDVTIGTMSAVPEPVNVALAFFGGILAVGSLFYRRRNATSATILN